MRRNTPAHTPRLSPTHNFLFVSDLHLAEGTNPQTGKIARLEDFFFDDAFANMLVYHVNLAQDPAVSSAFQKPWKLYINGDFFEFLQVVSVPDEDSPLVKDGKIILTDHLKMYGLGTSAEETVWKLKRIAAGHPSFFQALGWFLAHPEIVWPAVQEAIRTTIAGSYDVWYQDMINGRAPESSLPLKESLPVTLPIDFADRIGFPEWFDYEKGLFYVEHGNQYDPVNAFASIDRPFLESNPNLIELPSGSFFVRYLFNMVEQVHPFADNIVPLSSYINYAINLKPAETAVIFLRQPLTSFKAVFNLMRKSGKMRPEMQAGDDTVSRCPLPDDDVRAIEKVREDVSHLSRKRNKKYIRSVAAGVLLQALLWVMILLAFRGFILGFTPQTGLAIPLVLITYAWRLRLMHRLSKTPSNVGLDEAAHKINSILNKTNNESESKSVQFLIFGHNHDPKFEELSQHQNGRSYRQWYVNTGSWLPSFNETKTVIADSVRLSFLRIVPDQNGFDQALPELLEWRDTEHKPVKLKLTD
jgi:UDP-2,3-diacylglucosamine pyrophosphatase LpxH